MANDVVLIFYQIIGIQAFYYLGYGTLLGIFHIIFGCSVTLDRFFTPNYLNFESSEGVIEVFLMVLSSVIGFLFFCF